MTTRTTRARKGDTPAPQIDPTSDATTLRDTLSYAMQSDADPQQVLREIVQVFTPYCQSRSTLGHLHSLLHGVAMQLCGDQAAIPTDQLAKAMTKLDGAGAPRRSAAMSREQRPVAMP